MASKLKQQLMDNKRNIFYAGIILVTHFAYGIVANILGAVQVDLRFIYDISIDTSSYFTMAVQLGYLLGSLFGWLYRWINRQLALAAFILLMGVTSALVPHYQNFWVCIVAFVVCGIGSGAWDGASGFWMVEIFPVGNAGMLQLMQFMYGVGTMLAPLLAGPFVKGEKTFDEQNDRNITASDREHSLALPFLVTGVGPAAITTALVLLFFFCRYRPTTVSTEKSSRDGEKMEKTEAVEVAVVDESAIPNRMLKLALCGICLAAYASIELGWFNFSTTMYQYLDIHLDATTATHMQFIVSATYTLGRLTTTFIAAKLQPDIIIFYHYVTMIAGLLTIFIGRNSQLVITIGSAILGYGLSAMWPAILAFTERHLRLSDRICSIYSFLAGLISLIVPLILGQTFNAHPTMLFIIEAVFVSTSLGSFLLVKFLIFRDTGRLL